MYLSNFSTLANKVADPRPTLAKKVADPFSTLPNKVADPRHNKLIGQCII